MFEVLLETWSSFSVPLCLCGLLTLFACRKMARRQIPNMSFNIRDHLGQRTRVRHCVGAYRLPEGLPEGVEVTLEDFQPGYWTVSYNGSRFRVAMPCVGDSGMLPHPIGPRIPAVNHE
jgi:hypothetical protein